MSHEKSAIEWHRERIQAKGLFCACPICRPAPCVGNDHRKTNTLAAPQVREGIPQSLTEANTKNQQHGDSVMIDTTRNPAPTAPPPGAERILKQENRRHENATTSPLPVRTAEQRSSDTANRALGRRGATRRGRDVPDAGADQTRGGIGPHGLTRIETVLLVVVSALALLGGAYQLGATKARAAEQAVVLDSCRQAGAVFLRGHQVACRIEPVEVQP